jgi:hypothetical protein
VLVTIAILCATLAIGVMFALPSVAVRYGSDVVGRFLEKGAPYDARSLRAWIAQHPEAARGYAFPILFPLDLVFLCSLTGFAAAASMALAPERAVLGGLGWLFLVIPLTYGVTDLIEDVLLATMLVSPSSITDARVTVTQRITRVKIFTAMLSLAQVFVLSAAALWPHR